jgi:hypothetical protein
VTRPRAIAPPWSRSARPACSSSWSARSTRGRCASRARCSATCRRAPIRSSRCRASVPHPDRARRAATCNARSCRGTPAVRRWRRSRSPSPRPGATSPRSQTRATPCAEGYRLDGDKLFISNLGIAEITRWCSRRIDGPGASPGSGGLTAFWVPLATPGVAVDQPDRDGAASDRRARAAGCDRPRVGADRRGRAGHRSSRSRRSTRFACRSVPRRSAWRAARSTRP